MTFSAVVFLKSIFKLFIFSGVVDQCWKCSEIKKFSQNGHLKHHIRTVHDKIKSFECSHCPYKAAARSTLKKHILTHTRERIMEND